MKKRVLAIVLCAASLAACKTDRGEGTFGPGRIYISPVITRATEVNFEEGDRIGLTITKDGGEAYATNSLMTFAGNYFSGELMWYAEGAQASSLSAYYPYSASGAPAEFTVVADQSTGEGYEASDLLASYKSGVTPSNDAVAMTFQHMMSKIVVNVTNESGSDIKSVILRGSRTSANVDFEALTVAVAGTAGDITAQEVTPNSMYRAVVVPQEVAFTLVVETEAGATLTQELASMSLKQGGQYSAEARVMAEGIEVTISGEIQNWTDEGEIGAAEDEVQFEEGEGYFIYDGERYNTVTLANGQTWMAEPLRYIPEGFEPSTDPLADSHIWYPYELSGPTTSINATAATALTDAESIKTNGYFYDMYAALGGVEITVDNCYDYEGAQGICPKGWHIPTRMEFVGLCGLSNKAAEGESGNLIDESAVFYDEDYGGGKYTKYQDAGWNYVLSGVRMQTNFNAEPRYQLTQLWSGNTSFSEDMYGTPALTYIMSSTCYKPIYSTSNPEELTNIQFFGQMTTFTTKYPEGRINVAYVSIESGQQVRCVKDAE